MPTRKRSTPEEEEEIYQISDSEANTSRQGGRKRAVVSIDKFDIGPKDAFNFDQDTDNIITDDDDDDYQEEDEDDDEVSEQDYNDDSKDEQISIGSESDNDNVSETITDYYDGEEAEEEYGHYHSDNINEDERYARLLQQQEIALARSYLQDGFIGQEIIAAMAESEESIDMSYEGLLELQENLGEVKRRGLEEHTLKALPRLKYDKEMAGKGMETRNCVVCLNNFEAADELVKLNCDHHFHSECAIKWLRNRATCPVCREIIPDSIICIDLR